MAHRVKIYHFLNSNEYEITWWGRYGAKGEARALKTKKTPKEIEYQNRYNKHTYIRRLIKLNFTDGILFTLTYREGTRKPLDEVKKDLERYRNRMRRAYKKIGLPFKYIYCIEIGKRGGIHIHIIANRTNGKPETDRLAAQKWEHGHVNATPLYEDGDYERLACYMAKLPEETEKGSRLDNMEELTDENYSYGTSRNLIRPEPEEKIYLRRTVRKLLEEGPQPTEGYYIDKSTIRTGKNRFTGESYMYYTEQKVKRRERTPCSRCG